jgi:hypothetical protein
MSRVLFILLGPTLMASGGIAKPEEIRFNRDIRPILSDNCFACHGFDAAHRKGKLRLDTFEGATAEREGRRAITPGDPENSELWQRITSSFDDEVMPPPDSHKTLTAAQRALLKRWIEAGAPYEAHWAYQPVRREPAPAVRRTDWPRGELDRFVLARLEREGLSPSPEADRATWLRRVSFDLTGLPPTLAELDAFLTDRGEGAYERVVDRLLASPHYGERMAVDWLDAARYADTNGYQVDRDRELWAWRDWVIGAFNRNLPFDRFTIEQLAGDLLPQPTLEQRIATGFNRNHMINEEGGIIAEEFLAEYTADRVETTAAVWLGQTFSCNRCHDHKYDPFTQKDFYSLKAFFHNVPELGKSIRQSDFRFNSPPYVLLPSAEIDGKLAKLRAEHADRKRALDNLVSGTDEALRAWAQRIATARTRWATLAPVSASAEDQDPKVEPATGQVQLEYLNNTRLETKVRVAASPGRITALRITCAVTDIGGTFNLTDLRVRLRRGATATEIALRPGADLQSLPKDAALLVYDASPETRVPLRVQPGAPVTLVFELSEPIEVTEAKTELAFSIFSYGASSATRWRFEATSDESQWLASSAVRSAAAKAAEDRSAADHAALRSRFHATQPAGRQLEDELARLHRQIEATQREYSTTMVMEEMAKPRDTFILIRGAYDKKGERVEAATPGILPPLPEGAPRNRLGLARWLVEPANPLTARVTVNRFWQAVFGTGLVKTSEDFGSQGEPPSHPELLDWLASEFVRSGWDVKAFLRMLVTSATYRQQSRLTPELRERDPENRLLARGPRFRLMGEFVRDQALAASGLLVPKIGGPSVRPYHPPGLYEGVAPTSEDTVKTYVPGKGDDLHRRSLYTYWKRSVPHPAMLAFDVPFREVCSVKRSRTNTPLQALNLMNDPTYLEAARFIAGRMLREGGATADARLRFGFRLLLARDPKPAELGRMRAALAREVTAFTADRSAAEAFLAVGERRVEATYAAPELAAYALVASTLLCSDEVLTQQ